jgi:signal transduction histidine kinase/CheY-like chemotaxis protein
LCDKVVGPIPKSQKEDEIPIKWCPMRFGSDADNEAFAAEGWQWRARVLLATGFVVASLATFVYFRGTIRWMVVVASWLILGVNLTIFAVDNRHVSRPTKWRRISVAMMLHVMMHLFVVAVCIINIFSNYSISATRLPDGTWNTTFSLAEPGTDPDTIWFRQELLRLWLFAAPVVFVLLLPACQPAFWFGIALHVSVYPLMMAAVVGVTAPVAPEWLSGKSASYEKVAVVVFSTGFNLALQVALHTSRVAKFRQTLQLLLIVERLRVEIEAQKRWAFRIAHDFGTPLQAMIPAQEIIQAKWGDDLWVKIVSASLSALTRQREVMMDESRLHVGEALQPRRDTVDPLGFLNEITTISKSKAESAAVDFELVVIPDRLLPIVADASRIVNIALNLTSNGIKHAATRVQLVVPPPSGQDGWRIEVHDDGDGVPPEIAPALFGSIGTCAQAHDGGNGVGLWSVKKTCEYLDGDCGFGTSPRLGGAMFWFWVPYLPDLAAASMSGQQVLSTQVAAAAATTAATTAGAAVPMHILLVDDSPIILRTMQALLAQCGHTVSVAKNGRDGLEMMKAQRFNLVLSDIQMPLKDGIQMTRELRAWESDFRPMWPQPLVLMSANMSAKDLTTVRTMLSESDVPECSGPSELSVNQQGGVQGGKAVCVCVCVCVCGRSICL